VHLLNAYTKTLQVPQTSQIVEYSIESSKMMDLLSGRDNFYERRVVETGISVTCSEHACLHPLHSPYSSDVRVRPGHLHFCMHTAAFLKRHNTRLLRFVCGRISSTSQAEVALHWKYRDVLSTYTRWSVLWTAVPVPSTAESLPRMRVEYEQNDVRVRLWTPSLSVLFTWKL
jgi:hypothetical protein